MRARALPSPHPKEEEIGLLLAVWIWCSIWESDGALAVPEGEERCHCSLVYTKKEGIGNKPDIHGCRYGWINDASLLDTMLCACTSASFHGPPVRCVGTEGGGLGIPHLPAGAPSSSGKAICQQVCGKGRQQSPSYNKSWRCLRHSVTSKGGEQEFSKMSIKRGVKLQALGLNRGSVVR